jgi:hypothetical protein
MRWQLLVCCLLGTSVVSSPIVGQPRHPRAVSPGSPGTAEGIAGSCPTFSWSGVEAATGYELIVYRLTENRELETEFVIEVAGDARAWTPPAARCPRSGERYAWAVRARLERGPTPWSQALLFETAGRPSDDEVRQALGVLRRYRETVGEEGKGAPAGPPLEQVTVAPGAGREPGTSAASGVRQKAHLEALTTETTGAGQPAQTVVPSSFSLGVEGDLELGGFIFKDGRSFLHTHGGLVYRNTALGLDSLVNVTPGKPYTTNGTRNTALGQATLKSNTTGALNTASGAQALETNTTGYRNVATGDSALRFNTTGFDNTASGSFALFFNTTGAFNTAVGFLAGGYWTTGSYNIALGAGAYGLAGESGTIRIGGDDLQHRTFIEGIRGASGTQFDQAVCTSSQNQLGPCSPSSIRFKQDVVDMVDTAGLVKALRPVIYRYKAEGESEAEEPLQYGLIAEEVAEILPSLVTYDGEGRPDSVRYSLLAPLLLNEIQRQEGELADLRQTVADLERRLEALARKRRLGGP